MTEKDLDFGKSIEQIKGKYNGLFSSLTTEGTGIKDATVNPKIFDTTSSSSKVYSQSDVENALKSKDIATLRKISQTFYITSGIYKRLIRYLAFIYKMDYVVTPRIYKPNIKNKAIEDGLYKALYVLDNLNVRKVSKEIALKVLINGEDYELIIREGDNCRLQNLPADYCRSEIFSNGIPVVEFDMSYFDKVASQEDKRKAILSIYPKEIQKAYRLYKNNKLEDKLRKSGGRNKWYAIPAGTAFRFALDDDGCPLLVAAVLELLELNSGKAIDKQARLQRLMKILIQEIPTDEEFFKETSTEEFEELHKNAASVIGNAVGIGVLTTPLKSKVEDLVSTAGENSKKDDLEMLERQLFNEVGVTQSLFNSSSTVAIDRSIANDEASVSSLMCQFEDFYNLIINNSGNGRKGRNKVIYKVEMLPTTIYNYKDMIKIYKELGSIGFAKMLSSIAAGQTQSEVLGLLKLENEIFDINELLIPPMNTNNISSSYIDNKSGNNNNNANNKANTEDKKAGRPEKDLGEKSEKTIKNIEASGESV